MLPKPVFHPYFKKIFLPFLAVLTLVAGLGVSLNLVRERQTSTRASTNMVDLLISAPTNVNPNQQFTSTISVDPHTYKVSAIDLIMNVSSNLEIVSLQPETYLSTILTPADISGNSVRIILGSGTTPAQGAGILVSLVLKVKSDATGTAQVTVDPSTAVAGIDTSGTAVPTSILGDNGQTNITINSPTITLQTSIKFQGVTTQRPNQSVSVEIKQQNNSLYNNSVNFTSDASGKYSATITPNLSPGTYDIYIKGPVHLRKKFASAPLTSGINNLDLTVIPLKTGDIGTNNKVDTTDYSRMLLKFNPTLVQNTVEDINFDSRVDTSDYSLMLLNFNPLGSGD